MIRIGPAAQKVMLLLAGGAVLALAGSPGRYARILRVLSREWRYLERRALHRAIRRLYASKLINLHSHADGSVEVVLSREGRNVALRYQLDTMAIAIPERWDRKWRIIMFDVPEPQKQLRDTLRIKLKQLGLLELQKSVFVHPFACRDEVDFIIELYDARRYVRYIEATHIDNELHLKHRFKLAH